MAQDKKKIVKNSVKGTVEATVEAAGLATVQQNTLKEQVKMVKRRMKKKK